MREESWDRTAIEIKSLEERKIKSQRGRVQGDWSQKKARVFNLRASEPKNLAHHCGHDFRHS